MRLCAKSFAQSELSIKSGYQFYFAEPLIDLGSMKKNNNNFDLFLFNDHDHGAIFIECKTSISNANKTMKELSNSIDLVKTNISYFSNIIGIEIDLDKTEYVLCVFEIESRAVIDSMKSQAMKQKKSKYNPGLVKLWIFRPHSQLIQLHHDHEHNNKNLTEMLLAGFSEQKLRSQFELPYLITTHPFRLIILSIVGDCYAKNASNDSLPDPKIVKIEDIYATLYKNISLGMHEEVKSKLIKEKLNTIIKYGEKYELLEQINEKEIRLICVGKDLHVVIHNIKEKFIRKWIAIKSETEAEIKSLEEYKKLKGIKELSDFK
jgi:hypothetical protein